jgi:hypothetical protein
MVRLCFNLEKVPPGKSIEDLFSDAEGRNDYAPLSKLAHCLRKADNYIALPLASREKSSCYREFFQRFAGGCFVTFNYDALPETFLFRLGRWFPPDGYGVPVAADLLPGKEEFLGKKSRSSVLHLHGSLSVRTLDYEIRREPGHAIRMLAERDQAAYAFDPYSVNNFAPFQREVGSDDIQNRIIAPVPDKSRGLTRKFVKAICAKARPLLRTSGNVIAIGYSFNRYDNASYKPLLTALAESRDRRLLIVSPDAVTVAARLRAEFPNLCIEPRKATFKKWVSESYPGAL